jgi:protein TonB
MQMGGTAAQIRTQRIISMAVAVAILVGVGVALTLGLKQGFIQKKLEDIKVAVEKEKVIPKPPPPPPPQLKVPPPPFVPPPEFVIQTEPPPNTTAIQTQSVVKTPPAPPPTQLHAITRTHTLPPYPALALRLNQQGTSLLKVTISTDGNVTDAVVQKSSGFDALDQAAVSFVKSHWRWEPPTLNGKPTAAVTLVAIRWDVKNAQ